MYLEISLMVPITNSLAFLFTALGEWWAEGKIITSRKLDTCDLQGYSNRSCNKRHMAWYDDGAGRYSTMCAFQDQ